MKRRAISFMTALVLCLGLFPTPVLAADWEPVWEPDDLDFADLRLEGTTGAEGDFTVVRPYEIRRPEIFDTSGYECLAPGSTVLIIENGGRVYLTNSTIRSGKGNGIEIRAGGFLYVKDPGMNVIGTECGLNIASDAQVQICGGTFEGGTHGLNIASGAAVRITGGTFIGESAAISARDYGDLLATGYAFFNENDKILRPEEVSEAGTILQVKKCAGHVYDYTANPDKPTHRGKCVYCGETADLECEFRFDGDNNPKTAKCAVCERTLTITINKDKLVYNGIDKPSADAVEVSLEGGAKLTEGTDYTVDFSSRVEGEITVTVTSTSESHPWTYRESFSDTRATPVIRWETTETWTNTDELVEVGYTGSEAVLPKVTIEAENDSDKAELEQLLYFSYSTDSGANFKDGVPINAGTYQIKANLPATQNYHSASSNPINLKINKINPVKTPPAAVPDLTYDRNVHELVTPGSVWPGAVIQFALEKEDGPLSWSTEIPKAINAGNYTVYYMVDGTNNYIEVEQEKIDGVEIQQRWIEPGVKLDQTSFVYDNGTKEPPVTVTDPSDGNWVLPDTEYKVEYANNRNVGTATATVSPAGKNYDFDSVICQFTISTANQAGLTITGQPNQVFYGDVFTLSTTGGSGNGTVTWKITAAKNAAGGALGSSDFGDVAEINEDSGQITVKGLGSFTVQAKKSGTESGADGSETTNREDATAEVTFHVDPKPVTATVTAESREYDGSTDADVTAKVEQGVVSGDKITISGLIGTFSDENAGTGKTVTVSKGDDFKIEVPVETIGDDPDEKNYEKYVVTVPTTPVTADITPKPLGKDDLTVTLDCYSYDYDGTEKKPAVTVKVKNGTDEIPPKEYTVTYSNNVNVGTETAKAIVTDNPGGNYTIETVEVPFSITSGGQAVLTGSPQARDLTYNGESQDLVTVGTATGGTLKYALKTGSTDPEENDYKPEIPQGNDAGEYTVYYKVVGDANHGDSAVYSVYVTIKPKTVTSPEITLADKAFTYNGTPQTFVFNEPDDPDEPNEITVKDGSVEIPANEYTVTYSNNVNAGTATVHIVDKNGGNYNVSGSKPFQIGKDTAKFAPEPAKIDGLKYTGEAQALITAGRPEGGTAYYWLKGGAMSTSVPTGTGRGTYEVYAMVQGDANHNNSGETQIEVTIGQNIVTDPIIDLSSKQFTYNGSEQKPTVTMWDDARNLISPNEYSVEYNGNTINVGTYQIKITSEEINYHFDFKEEPELEVTILPADQEALNIIDRPSKVYFDDTIQLSTTGGSGNGAVTWSVVEEKTEKDENEKPIAKKGESEGQFIIKGVGDITVKATRTPVAGSGYGIAEAEWKFHAFPKPVDAVVTVKDKEYDGTADAELDSITVPGTDISFDGYKNIKGTFFNKNVGINIPVSFTITDDLLTITNGDNYVITYPSTATASIKPAAVKVAGTVTDDDPMAEGNHPTAANPEYNGSARELVVPGKNLDGGVWVYSLDGVSYSQVLPEAVKAGDYTVWYKVLADSNYKYEDGPKSVTVTIRKKPVNVTVKCSPETFPYDGTEKTPNVIVTYTEGSEVEEIPASNYTVEFPKERTAANTPENENYKVTVTAKENGNYEFTNSAEGTFKIVPADQAPLTIVTEKPEFVYYDDTFRLSAVGGSGEGKIVWGILDESGVSVPQTAIAEITTDGVVTVNDVGSFTVTAYREQTAGSYKDSDSDSKTFTAKPKQVTAVVTADDKDYDGSTEAKLTVTVDGNTVKAKEDISDPKDAIKGEFLDGNVGTNKTVKVTIKSANVTFLNDDKYDVTWPEKTTASINPADVKVEDPVGTIRKMTDNDYPTGNSLTYSSGSEQLLLTKGTKLVGGFWAYSTDRVIYSQDIPKGTDAGEYEVWCTVIPDKNYKYDADPKLVTATIGKADQAELKILEPSSSTYDYGDQFALKASGGSGSGAVSWSWEDSDALTFDPNTGRVTVAAANRSVTITATKAGDQNYNQISSDFLFATQKKPITAVIEVKDVRYDEVGQDKKATITSVTWVDLDEKPVSVDDDNLKDIKDKLSATFDEVAVGPQNVTISWTGSQPMSDKYDITIPEKTTATILPAELNRPDITVDAIEDLTYNGGGQELVDVSGDGSVTLVYAVYSVDEGKYWNWTESKYEDVEKYESSIPTAKDAGTYKVYYKVGSDNNSVGSVEVKIAKATPVIDQYPEATPIKKGDMLSNDGLVGGKAVYTDYSGQKQDIPGIFTWNPVQKPLLDNYACPVLFTPHDTKNFETKSLTATVHFIKEETSGSTTNSTNNSNSTNSSYSSDDSSSSDTSSSTNTTQSASKPGTGSVSMQTTVQDKTASTVLDSAAGSQLVSEAVANKSANVVIKPEITGDVSKTEVSIPASAVSRIGSETDAALTVSTPVADVTIPNASLDTFSGAGGAVSVVTERVENTVVLTLSADGKDIGDVPGGLTLTVPSENTTPGTVAVLVHEDGTREIIRKSVAEDGSVRIPLNGSATVEIVDNSKQFADVPAESWAADAVAFASAHEILNGTGEATFSPEISMSRAMLATVLYNLEGCPDQELTGEFSDVSSDAWYAAGVSWAAANGITSGYGDGQYGPNDDITREQLAVMLWRYMESPAADKQVPDFTDTDQASSYAMEALYWAAANGIVNGYGNGQLDPSGMATRAQAAQMLKNFIENT